MSVAVTIKGIHFADFHLGVDTVGPLDPVTRLNGRVMDYLDALDALKEFAYEEDIDLVLFAGDAFHRHNPDPTYVREFGDRIVALAEHCPVVLLPGNHDLPGSIDRASAVDIFDTLRVQNVVVGWDYEVHSVRSVHGTVQVVTVPYPIKQQLLTNKELRGAPGQVKAHIRDRMEAKIRKLASQVDPDLPAILLGHFSVDTALWGSEHRLMVGADASVRLSSLIEYPWDYVALGHLHNFQDLTEEIQDSSLKIPPVVYSGSLERIDFGEEHDDKGFVLFEISKETTKYEFVQTDARPYMTVEINVSRLKNQTERVVQKISKSHLKDAVVRVKVTTDSSIKVRRQDIYKAIESAGAYCIHSLNIFQEDPDVEPYRELVSEEGVPISQLPHPDALKLYLRSLGNKGKELDSLCSLGNEIIEEVQHEQERSRAGRVTRRSRGS